MYLNAEISGNSSVGLWPGGRHLDTADTITVLNSKSDVSRFSPGGSPGVSDDVVVLSVLGSPSDGNDTVVELGSASGSGNNTTSVVLEWSLVGLNSNRDWSVLEGSLEGGGGSNLNVSVSGGGNNTVGRFGRRAGSSDSESSGGIGVVRLEHLWGGLGVFESVVHKSTIASTVLGGAGNQLLLRKRKEGSGSDLMVSLKSSGGREGPA